MEKFELFEIVNKMREMRISDTSILNELMHVMSDIVLEENLREVDRNFDTNLFD